MHNSTNSLNVRQHILLTKSAESSQDREKKRTEQLSCINGVKIHIYVDRVRLGISRMLESLKRPSIEVD
ncbi:hypothetical protein Peur_064335 [Populus x canadensis]